MLNIFINTMDRVEIIKTVYNDQIDSELMLIEDTIHSLGIDETPLSNFLDSEIFPYFNDIRNKELFLC